MRIYNLDHRLALGVAPGRAADVERASGGRFGQDIQAVYGHWDAFTA